jgi:hypothetical protein
MGQITAPNSRPPATKPNINVNINMLAAHMSGNRRFVIAIDPATITGNGDTANINRQSVTIGRRP